MKPRASLEKRRKERARQDRKRDKAERRDQRRAERASRGPRDAAGDPDLAGIVPGPQPDLGSDDGPAERGEPR